MCFCFTRGANFGTILFNLAEIAPPGEGGGRNIVDIPGHIGDKANHVQRPSAKKFFAESDTVAVPASAKEPSAS